MATNLQDYLKGSGSVVAARKKLTAAQARLAEAKRAAGAVRQGDPFYDDIQIRLNNALADVNDAKVAESQIVEKATRYFEANKEAIAAKAAAKTAERKEAGLANLYRQRDEMLKAGLDVTAINNIIKNATAQEPAAKAKGKKAAEGEKQTKFTPRDYATELGTTGQAIAKMSEAQRLALSKRLKAAGYNVNVTGVYNQNLIDVYTQAIADNQIRSVNFQTEIDFETFLDTKARETASLGTGQAAEGYTPVATISSPTEARAYIQSVIKSTLGRDATSTELTELTAKLNEAQRKNPEKQKLNKQGILERTGGVNAQEFLTAEIRKLPEYKQRVTAESDINKTSLAATARANGLNLDSNFDKATIDSWIKRVQNGEDIDIFKTKIRQQAFRSLPESVRNALDPELDLNSNLATYINSYAKTFGIPATQVDVNRIIPLATNDKGFVSTFEFEKKKRGLADWQYTPEAMDEVSNIANKVLRDFGFQG